jgi:hypothetical protein
LVGGPWYTSAPSSDNTRIVVLLTVVMLTVSDSRNISHRAAGPTWMRLVLTSKL